VIVARGNTIFKMFTSNENACSEQSVVQHDVTEATERAHVASDAFEAIVANVPSGLPHPDGTQRILNASRTLSAARQEMMRAHGRLHDFLTRGTIPEDLKKGGRVAD